MLLARTKVKNMIFEQNLVTKRLQIHKMKNPPFPALIAGEGGSVGNTTVSHRSKNHLSGLSTM